MDGPLPKYMGKGQAEVYKISAFFGNYNFVDHKICNFFTLCIPYNGLWIRVDPGSVKGRSSGQRPPYH